MDQIKSKSDLRYFLEADRIALGRKKIYIFSWAWFKHLLMPDYIYRFQILLRRIEYHHNCRKKNLYDRIVFTFLYRKFLRQSLALGFSIHPNNFGPGLSIAHYGTIVVNHAARIGKNCRIHVCVNIGTAAGSEDEAPRVGDNVYIGPGAKLFGNITVANGSVIGANAVVNRSFPEENSLIAGVPAKVLGSTDSSKYLIKGADLADRIGCLNPKQ